MAIKVSYINQGAIEKRLAEIKADADPRSYKVRKLREDIGAAVIEDNIDKVINRSVDRYGKALAPLAPATLANPRRGPGPTLAPRGLAARVITTFKVRWAMAGAGETWRMSAGWVDFLSPKGYPIMLAQLGGAPSRHLPARDVGGVSPKGWTKVRQAFTDFRIRLAKKGA